MSKVENILDDFICDAKLKKEIDEIIKDCNLDTNDFENMIEAYEINYKTKIIE